jgi:hypothetical protein
MRKTLKYVTENGSRFSIKQELRVYFNPEEKFSIMSDDNALKDGTA